MLTRRWTRYGSAAVTIGAPIPIAGWLTARDDSGRTLLELPREERLPRVQAFADRAMEEVARLIPVTAVPLVCAALQTFPAEFVSRDALLDRVDALRDGLNDVNARAINAERIEDAMDRGCAMLRLRHAIVESGDGYTVLPQGRELISYYANSIEPLLGGFSDDVRARDTLPASTLIDA